MVWIEIIASLSRQYDLKLLTPLSPQRVSDAVAGLQLSNEFFEFYSVTNGLVYDWFQIFPIYDESNKKFTWDSLQKANDLELSKFSVDAEFLDRFVIIGEIGSGEAVIVEKADESIWYGENEEFHQTNMSLEGLMHTCLREVDDL